MFKMGFKVAGGIYKDIKAHQRRMEGGVTRAVRKATYGLRDDWRTQISAAGLGDKLPRTVQAQLYPKGDKSINAAGIVWTKAPHIISAYDQGVLIQGGLQTKTRNRGRGPVGAGARGADRFGIAKTSRPGLFLAIPTKNVPSRGRGRKHTPTTWPTNLPPLRLVVLKNGTLLLVADDLRRSYSKKTGKFRGYKAASKRAIKRGEDLDNITMFVLVRQVRIPKRLDVQKEYKKWAAAFPGLLSGNIHNGR